MCAEKDYASKTFVTGTRNMTFLVLVTGQLSALTFNFLSRT